jgi:Domain of unknown function (DUF4375)
MELRISRATVEGLDLESYFWALVEPVWGAAWENEASLLSTATRGQRALYVVTLCIREVCNGGFEQFFHNTSGMYAADVCKALRLIEAEEHSAAFEKALKVFPEGLVPLDQEERQSLLEMIPRWRRKAFFKPLEEEFFEEERIWQCFDKYVDMHPREFFVDAPIRRGAQNRPRIRNTRPT